MNPKKSLHLLPIILATLVVTTVLSLSVAAASETATGTIGQVAENSFTLQVDGGGTMEFVTDSNTVVDGELKAGAQATVTYRSEDGRNIAERVQVTS